MAVVLVIVAAVLVVVIGLVIVGRETARLAGVVRPAVFDLAEATEYIADRLPADAQARMSHDDVRWILLADADLLEEATAEREEPRYPWSRDRPRVHPLPIEARRHGGAARDRSDGTADATEVGPGGRGEVAEQHEVAGQPEVAGRGEVAEQPEVVDQDRAIARILALAEREDRDLRDEDVASVLDLRLDYLEEIGAVGGEADDDELPPGSGPRPGVE